MSKQRPTPKREYPPLSVLINDNPHWAPRGERANYGRLHTSDRYLDYVLEALPLKLRYAALVEPSFRTPHQESKVPEAHQPPYLFFALKDGRIVRVACETPKGNNIIRLSTCTNPQVTTHLHENWCGPIFVGSQPMKKAVMDQLIAIFEAALSSPQAPAAV